MTGYTCAFRGCRSKTGGGISLFCFPKDHDRAKLWLEACCRTDLFSKTAEELSQNYRLCEFHFEVKYCNTGVSRKRLLANASPTLFPHALKRTCEEKELQRPPSKNIILSGNSVSTDRIESNIHCKAESSSKYEYQLQYSDRPEIITIINLERADTQDVYHNFEEQATGIKQEPIEISCKDFLSNIPIKTENFETVASVEEGNSGPLLKDFMVKNDELDIKNEEDINERSYNPSMAVPVKTENHELTAIEEQNMNRLLQGLPNKHEEVDIKIEEDINMSGCKDSLSEVPTKTENVVTMASMEESNSGRLLRDFIKKEEDINESNYDNPLMAVPVKTENHETTAIEVQNMKRLLEDLPNTNEEIDLKIEENMNITGSSCVKSDNRLLPNHTVSNQGSFTTSCGPDNILRCNECSYQTKVVADFKKHLCRHKSKTLYRCNHCNYESTDKQAIKKHMIYHKNPSKVDKQVVVYFKKHLFRHKNKTLYRCNHCNYESTDKQAIMKHMIGHKDLNKVDKHKCDQCPYQSANKSNLNRHILMHRSPSEVKMYRCEKCNFQTRYKSKVRRHVGGHKLFLADDRLVHKKECEEAYP